MYKKTQWIIYNSKDEMLKAYITKAFNKYLELNVMVRLSKEGILTGFYIDLHVKRGTSIKINRKGKIKIDNDYCNYFKNGINSVLSWHCSGIAWPLFKEAEDFFLIRHNKYHTLRQDIATNKIKRQFKISISNPEYQMCRNRLMKEFSEL